MRSPSVFSECNARPNFLRTTPAKNPRTECCCQPVAFMIAAIVVPVGCLSNASTVACLEFGRIVAARAVIAREAPCLPAERALAFLVVLLLGMLGSFLR